MTFEDILGAVARGWCHEKTSHIRMDVDLAIAIAKEVQKLYTSKQPVQNSQEFIHDPAEIRRVFEIDDAERPDPDTGFALL